MLRLENHFWSIRLTTGKGAFKMGKLDGKVAVITGGNSGIGLATAQEFINEGAKVAISGRNQTTIESALEQLGSNAIGFKSDVSSGSDLDSFYEKVAIAYRKIDIVFANAGIAFGNMMGETKEEEIDSHFDINVKGVFFTVQKALPLLNDGGSIILTASIVKDKGFENFSVYSASKAAVRSFARSWANDLKNRKIRVNSISPGPIETPIFSRMGMSEEELKAMGEGFAAQVPLGRFGKPEEIAKTALFLASDGSYVNGSDIAVDGGIAQV